MMKKIVILLVVILLLSTLVLPQSAFAKSEKIKEEKGKVATYTLVGGRFCSGGGLTTATGTNEKGKKSKVVTYTLIGGFY